MSFSRVLVSLFAMLVRCRRLLFGLFVLALTVLVRCLKVVISRSSVVCGSRVMLLDGRMFILAMIANPALFRSQAA